MSNRIRLVSDGRVQGTRALMPDGTEIPNVTRVVIEPIDGADRRGLVRALLQVEAVALDLVAEVPAEGGDPAGMHHGGASRGP